MSSRHTGPNRSVIEAAGGVISDTRDGYAVSFPEAERLAKAKADEIEQAIQRAKDFGTVVLPLWRERGAGWYVSNSHDEHPGCWYICQIDAMTGQPVGCECVASHVCHHLGAAIALFREKVGYEANGAAALEGWQETLARLEAVRLHGPEEEAWT